MVLVVSESTSVTAPEPVRVELNTPPTSSPQSLAISPDGRFVVFVGNSGERSQLWIRSLTAERARPLDGTDAAAYPFWSPDSRQRIGDAQSLRLALEGAFETTPPQTTAASASSSASGGRLAWMAFAVAAVSAAALAVPTVRHLRESPPPETRVEINTPATGEPAS